MVVKLEHPVTAIMELDEYKEFVDTHVDFLDYDSICETAWALKALANNRRFLGQEISRQLTSYVDGRPFKGDTPYSIIFVNCRDYAIRANVWLPLSEDPVRRQHEATFFGYSGYHDHNFHLVTAGYFGPGYDSDLYQYERGNPVYNPGDPVDLEYKGRIRLAVGDVITYKAFHDIHSQEPPADVSVSLNLRVHPPELDQRRLFFFDVKAGTVTSPVSNGDEKFAEFITMARHLFNEDSIGPLMSLARQHPAEAVRRNAALELRFLYPNDTDYFVRQAAR
jgi:hypothetical protein